ncbi:MAG: hypothetical protein HQL48_08740, partial [Gammaproteobacteria bacterium]|nr:hypothetical protein [Gammaproteobacteria bacterium]
IAIQVPSPLKDELDRLSYHRYGGSGQPWKGGQEMWRALRAFKRQEQEAAQSGDEPQLLRPLYTQDTQQP